MALNRAYFDQLQDLDLLFLQFVQLFKQRYSDPKVQEHLLIDLQYKIEKSLEQFRPIVSALLPLMAFETQTMKKLILTAESQINELGVYDSLLKAKLHKLPSPSQ